LRIQVKLIGQFSLKCGFTEKDVELPDASTVADALKKLGLKDLPYVASIRGHGVKDEAPLKDGERLVVSPVFSGG